MAETGKLIVRKGVIEDAEDIAALEVVCFADPWSKESLEYELGENPRAVYIVAEHEGQVVGYVGVWGIVDEGHITNVAVSPDYRRRNIGSVLIYHMLKATIQAGLVRHTLEVRAGNTAAQALYRKFGFEEAGVRKGYYQDNGEDAIIMWRDSETEAGL